MCVMSSATCDEEPIKMLLGSAIEDPTGIGTDAFPHARAQVNCDPSGIACVVGGGLPGRSAPLRLPPGELSWDPVLGSFASAMVTVKSDHVSPVSTPFVSSLSIDGDEIRFDLAIS
jgi:hypothetical protein